MLLSANTFATDAPKKEEPPPKLIDVFGMAPKIGKYDPTSGKVTILEGHKAEEVVDVAMQSAFNSAAQLQQTQKALQECQAKKVKK